MTIENVNENLANAIGAGIEQLIKSNITSLNVDNSSELPDRIRDELDDMIYERVHEVVENMIDDRVSEAIDTCLTDKLNDLTITFE
jgi:hypothetical protein